MGRAYFQIAKMHPFFVSLNIISQTSVVVNTFFNNFPLPLQALFHSVLTPLFRLYNIRKDLLYTCFRAFYLTH
jgi:hypothetical protein